MEQSHEKAPSDARIYIVVGLFFICIVGGGVFLAMYVFLPESPPWYAQAGIVLVGIPWLVWLLTYIYSCVKIYRNARAMENNNVGRIFPKSALSQRSRSTTEMTRHDTAQSPAELLEEDSNQEQEDSDSYDDGDDHGKKVESQTVIKGRESEIPLTSSSSS